MEKKTIGSFIAALRRANGLTQRQLADKLCVSDKAVSRWERDEALPDLSLIPELADIFGVTADDILRGERKNPEAIASPTSDKGEKLRKRLLAKKKTTYKILSAISIGISVIGLLTATLINFCGYMSMTGFFFGAAFFTASVILQIGAIIGTLSDLDEEMLTQTEQIARNEYTFKLAFGSFMTTFMLLMICLPLTFDNDGLPVLNWLTMGIICEIIGLFIGLIAYLIVNTRLYKRGIIHMEIRQAEKNRLRIRFVKLFLLSLAVLMIIQAASVVIVDNVDLSRVVFDNWDDFKEFLERPITKYRIEYDPQYRDNIQKTITDEKGNILCTFYHWNTGVIGWEYSQKEDGTWQIEVADFSKLYLRDKFMQSVIFPAFILTYPVATLVFYISYRKKVKKL